MDNYHIVYCIISEGVPYSNPAYSSNYLPPLEYIHHLEVDTPPREQAIQGPSLSGWRVACGEGQSNGSMVSSK
jgi:hypothetical protein